MMDERSNEYKMHIPRLREQRFAAKAIIASYPDKNRSLSTLQTICRRVDETGSAVTCHVRRSLCCCSWWTFWTLCFNTKWADDIHHWNVWTVDEKLRKVWFVIREYSTRNCMFTWKSEL